MIRVPSFFLFLAVFLTGTVSLHAAGRTVTGKQYAAGTGQTFSYFAGGLPHEVSVARSTGGSLTYGYSTDGAKDLTSAAWPEVTSGVFTIPPATQGYGYDRAGRLRTIGDSSGNRTQAYQNGRLKATTWNSGLFAGNQLITDLDTSGRDCGFTINRNGTTIHSATRVPNGVSGEISEVSSGGLTIVIKRNAARQITGFEWHPTDPTAPVVTQTWSRGSAGRILSARSSVVGSPSFDWINDQTKTLRISAASGARVWAGLAGGDLTEIPDFNLTGSSNLTLPSTQSSGWVPWHTLAMLPGEGEGTFGANAVYNPLASPDAKAEQFGAVWIPPVNETFAYDADGNRQSTALWDYGWDGRNKLVRARTKDYNISTTPQGYDVTCDYDADGRRFKKYVTTYQNGSIVSQDHITFLWDGWDMIYERHQQPSGLTTLERKYVWGPDLSGSHGGAGGAGGLLLIRETRGTQTKDYYPLYDGCGHVIALADSNGNLVAEYAYGPFGELIHANGPMAQAIPIRYATKYYDSEMGLYYFGQRYLDPITGQWISREPLGEDESLNLYAYCGNDPVNAVDAQGEAEYRINPGSQPQLLNKAENIWKLVYDIQVNKGWFSDNWQDAGQMELPGATLSTMDAAKRYLGMERYHNEFAKDESLVNSCLDVAKTGELLGKVRFWSEVIPGGGSGVAFSDGKYGKASVLLVKDVGLTLTGAKWMGASKTMRQLALSSAAFGGLNGATTSIVDISYNRVEALIEGHQYDGTLSEDTWMVLKSAGAGAAIGAVLGPTARVIQLKGRVGKILAANSGARLAGSGPAAGVLEVSPLVKSTKAFQNYSPGSSVEFVFDPSSSRFVVGKAAGAGSPHQNLAATINGNSSVVGGMFQRGSNGQILTNEFSGHYWQNWTPQIRTQFQSFLESSTGQSMIHTP